MTKKLPQFKHFPFISKSIVGWMRNTKDMTISSKKVKKSKEDYLENAIKWLCQAQDVNDDGGVSSQFSLKNGWFASFPETTGYIIPTFFDYSVYSGEKIYHERAIKMADWEVSIQLDDGSFQGGTIDMKPEPIVFNTGQVIFGLIDTYRFTKKKKYLNAAVKAGEWLVKNQEKNGSWEKFTYKKIVHVYNIRTAWALMKLYEFTKNDAYLKCVEKNVEWVLKNQNKNGFFMNNPNVTHYIAYTIRGLLEIGLSLDNKKIIDSSFKPAQKIMKRFMVDRFIYGTYDNNWRSQDNYTCLTGDAQLSIIWQKIYQYNNDKRFFDQALIINDFLKTCQYSGGNINMKGAIPGSYPIWGKYFSFSYPNWATKFLADALLLEQKIKRERGEE